uniref:Uncharacterized protein n=1 Tax=Solanum tuberosum TaxID=4113 RepID=M1D953_SOLTU
MDDETFDPVGIEIWKLCPYHDAIDHSIGMCLRSKAPKNSFPGQNSQKGKAVMGDNNEEIGPIDVVVAQPVVADQNELIRQLMQQITEIWVEMQRRKDLPNPFFTFNALADGRPPLHFPPSNVEQAQHPPSNPAHNPSIIDLTTQNPHYAFASYQTLPPPQSTNPQAPLPPQNANLQACPPPQNQNVIHPHTSLHHLNQHTCPQTFPQNYQAPQNAQSPSIAPPLPQKATFQIPVPNEPYANFSELDHYTERERVEIKGRGRQAGYEGRDLKGHE